MKAIRWSGEDDKYFGPFTYAYDARYKSLSIVLGSGDGDDYAGCRLRLSAFGHTLILALPAIIKPWRRWHVITTEPTRSRMVAQGRDPGYWEAHSQEYGFTAAEGALHLYYGPQTHDSDTTKSKCWFFPWREHRCIRHSIYDLKGKFFADLPMRGRFTDNYAATKALEEACPSALFEFDDFDGERITATCRMEEREWTRGKGVFRLLYLGRNEVSRGLDMRFSSEVGERKGSWKGGTIGHSITLLPNELHEAGFRRYCEKEGLKFIGEKNKVSV
jgi:hypothetical protein